MAEIAVPAVLKETVIGRDCPMPIVLVEGEMLIVAVPPDTEACICPVEASNSKTMANITTLFNLIISPNFKCRIVA